MDYVVTVLPEGVRFPAKSGETLLTAARRFGFGFRVGCRKGGCGECLLQLVSGEVMYLKTVAQSVLSDSDRADGRCLPCRAVPTSDVVIRLSLSDRLKRGPYSDWLATGALAKAGHVIQQQGDSTLL